MFEQAFQNVDDVLWKEAGCTTELDDIEQISWLLFLKYLDGLEHDKTDEAALVGRKYTSRHQARPSSRASTIPRAPRQGATGYTNP